ncbi:MAG: ankyrin repeat domain-containing protein [Prolixibacteraceae bacterium]
MNDQSTTTMPSGVNKSYLHRCIEQRYFEQEETRAWNCDQAFEKILDPLNSKNYARACIEAEFLVPNYKDFATIFFWWGGALLKMKEYDKARSLLVKALENTREKFVLCNRLGEIEWGTRNISEAVYWWSQGMHCQESLSSKNYGSETGSYLYLFYVAQGLGLEDCASTFISRSDTIEPGRIRLEQQIGNDLIELARNAKDSSISQVLKGLQKKYFLNKFMNENELFKAAIKGDVKLIKQLLEVGIKVESRNQEGKTSLHLAAENGHLEAVKELLKQGAQIECPVIVSGTAINITPASLAASRGQLEILKYLAEVGAALYEPDGYMGYFSVMYGAAASGNLEMVKFLHEEKQIPINDRDSLGFSPLDMATEKGHKHIINYLTGKKNKNDSRKKWWQLWK